jgi:hypothetical protein
VTDAIETNQTPSPFDLEARKAEAARIAAKADGKEAEALASAGKAVSDGKTNGSAGAGRVAVAKPSAST